MWFEVWTTPFGFLAFVEFHIGQCCGRLFGAW